MVIPVRADRHLDDIRPYGYGGEKDAAPRTLFSGFERLLRSVDRFESSVDDVAPLEHTLLNTGLFEAWQLSVEEGNRLTSA